jgi:hypothetical protein
MIKSPWLTISINPPKLDVVIVARTADEFGYGARNEVYTFDSKVFTGDEAASHLENLSYIQWMELPL